MPKSADTGPEVPEAFHDLLGTISKVPKATLRAELTSNAVKLEQSALQGRMAGKSKVPTAMPIDQFFQPEKAEKDSLLTRTSRVLTVGGLAAVGGGLAYTVGLPHLAAFMATHSDGMKFALGGAGVVGGLYGAKKTKDYIVGGWDAVKGKTK